MRDVSAPELNELLRQEQVTLVDTLDEESYRMRHLPGAINIPGRSGGFVERVQLLVADKNATIVTYCSSPDSILSSEAARKLDAAGYPNVLEFRGGLEAWQHEGYSFETAFGTLRTPVGILSEQ